MIACFYFVLSSLWENRIIGYVLSTNLLFLFVDTNDLTNVSSIPESADLADTYYSNYDDFESDVSSDDYDDFSGSDESDADGKTSGDYEALVGCMENALDLSEEDVQSTFGDSLPAPNSTSNGLPIRQQKIQKLRK